MKGIYKGMKWKITRRKDLDIKGDNGTTYIFTADLDGRKYRESIVKRYSKPHRRVMYDNSLDTFMASNQKDIAEHLCHLFIDVYLENTHLLA